MPTDVRMRVDPIGRQVRDTLALGEPVHRIELHAEESAARSRWILLGGERRCRAGDVAQIREAVRPQILLQEQRRNGRDEREAGDVLAHASCR